MKSQKENLLINLRNAAKSLGGKIHVAGQGQKRQVRLTNCDNYNCVVWYPVDQDIGIQNLKDAAKWIFGPYAHKNELRAVINPYNEKGILIPPMR